jgi:hypothetical protein
MLRQVCNLRKRREVMPRAEVMCGRMQEPLQLRLPYSFVGGCSSVFFARSSEINSLMPLTAT